MALGAACEDHPQLGQRRRHKVEAGVTQPGWSRPAGGIGDFSRASGPLCSLPLDPGFSGLAARPEYGEQSSQEPEALAARGLLALWRYRKVLALWRYRKVLALWRYRRC